jgi:hypothetical protein
MMAPQEPYGTTPSLEGEGRHQGYPRAPEPIEIAIEAPAGLQLDHDPSEAEIRAALEAFGPVEVLDVVDNRDPQRAVKLRALHAGEAPSPAYSTPRGRRLPLDGTLDDFHAAVDQLLDRDTCNGDRCGPGHRCRRHRRRPA